MTLLQRASNFTKRVLTIYTFNIQYTDHSENLRNVDRNINAYKFIWIKKYDTNILQYCHIFNCRQKPKNSSRSWRIADLKFDLLIEIVI